MPITDYLEKNARLHPGDVALVEINPANQPEKNVTWREFNLIESASGGKYRREITWKDFDERANRFANLLFTRGIRKGDKVAILLMNCIEWLPIYFGILKTGAVAVPMNYRFDSNEIQYCVDLADVRMLVFGPEFLSRVEQVLPAVKEQVTDFFYVGDKNETPVYAGNYEELVGYCAATAPAVEILDSDDAAIYFSSGTTGFPKAILHAHRALVGSAVTEQHHHGRHGMMSSFASRRSITPVPNALVREPHFLQQSRTSPRSQTGMDLAGGFRRTRHYRLAARTVGAGYSRRNRKRGITFRIPHRPMAPHAHRRTACSALAHQALDEGVSESSIRHQLRAVGIHRSRRGSSRRGKHREGRCNRDSRVRVGSQNH